MNALVFLTCLFLISNSFLSAESARILISALFGEGSHYTSVVPVGKNLVEQGHDVTFLISEEYAHRALVPEHAELFNFEMFTYPGNQDRIYALTNDLFNMNYYNNASALQMMHFLSSWPKFNAKACDDVLANKELLQRLKDTDAIMFDVGWSCPVYMQSYIQRHLGGQDIPLIMLTMTTPVSHVFQQAGSPFNPSYQPVSNTGFGSVMSFTERVANTIADYIFTAMWKNIMSTSLEHLVDKYDLEPYLKVSLAKAIDLYLMNMDFALEVPAPLPPAMIPVGGLSTRPTRSLADQDLEVFMQSSGDDGAIVFSLGTYFTTVLTSKPELLGMFLEAFRRVPQKVVMQLQDYPREKIPENVRAMSWLPQNDLLGHPKTRLFVYQGGNNGVYEALYHGVPMIVLPIGADQVDTAARVEDCGIGISEKWHDLSVEIILARITEVIQNPLFADNARRLSAIYRSRPMTPAERAAFWVDHVIVHGGDYFRSPVSDLNFIQRNLIDVYLTFALIIGTVIYAMFRFFTLCLKCWCCKGNVEKHGHSKTD